MPGTAHTKRLQRIVEEYRKAGMLWPATANDIATWGFRQGLLEARPNDAIRLCADQISRAMAKEHYTDPQGREVRAKHPRRVLIDGKQQSLWGDIREEPRPFVEASFKQRRSAIAADCIRLKTDIDSANDNRWPDNPIQLSLNFAADAAEAQTMDMLTHGGDSIVLSQPSWLPPTFAPATTLPSLPSHP